MGSLFGGFDEGGGISINVQSNNAEAMRRAAKKGYDLLLKRFPDAVINTNPSLEFDQPQLKLVADDRAIAEAGWTRGDIGNITQMLGEGNYVGQRYDGEKQLYLIMKAQTIDSPQALLDTPVATPTNTVVPSVISCTCNARWPPAASIVSTAAAPSRSTSSRRVASRSATR